MTTAVCEAPIFEGDVGTIFRVIVTECVNGVDQVVDVSSATTQELKFRKPDGTVETKTSQFTTDGTDGKIEYTTTSGDLDAIGVWQIQGRVILPTGEWHTAIGTFEALSRLQ